MTVSSAPGTPSRSYTPSKTKQASKPADVLQKVQELQAEKAFLEKEVETYRKDTVTETKRYEDRIRALLTELDTLKQSNRSLEDKWKETKKEKIDLHSQNVVLANKLKQAENHLAKLEQSQSLNRSTPTKAAGAGAEKQLKLLQAKYDDHMKEAEETIVYLETKLEDAEDTIKDLEAQNTILEMKIARLETSHDYAVGLEKELENMNDMSTRLDELERQNYSLNQALAGRKSEKTSHALNDVADLTQKLKIEE
ncbi:hypothetical protein MP638_002152 [Amoeboaphelidium occidentale]|nr:hypothetical protein MP638_002152 [Amoeboaphelidium occidentale]